MPIKAVFTFERNHNRTWYDSEKEFNDENHLRAYVRKCISNGDPSRPKYINHRILHANETKIFNLNDAQRIFDLAKDYESLNELLLKEFKLRI